MLLYRLARETAIYLVFFYALDAFYNWQVPDWAWVDLRLWVIISAAFACFFGRRE